MTRWNTLLATAAIALGLTATLAQAQPDHRRGPPGHSQAGGQGHGKGHAGPDRRGPDRHAGPDRRGPDRHAGPDRRGPDRHDMDRRGHDGRHHAHGGRHGAGPDHRWVRGSRIPPQYRTRHYVVNDWRGHRLSAPPRGYHWVQNGGDYLLVAIASGVIAQLILSN